MAVDFHTPPVELSIGVTSYLLALAAILPASGWIADRFGTRRTFLLAMLGFVATSVLCALSTGLLQFAAARALQGTFGALMTPVARIAMVRSIRGERLAKAMNLCAMMALLGPAIGPPLGGWLATYWSWRWIFLINVPAGVVGWLLARAALPDYRAHKPRQFDGAGFAINAAALMSVLYGLEALSKSTGDWRMAGGMVLLGAALSVLAVRHARHRPQGLIDVLALRTASFRDGLFGGMWFRLAIFAPMFLLPLMLQLGLGFDAFTAGLYIMIGAGADVLTKLVVMPTLRALGFWRVLVLTSVLYALYPLCLMLVDGHTPAWLIAVLLFFGGCTRSLQMSASNMIIYAELPPERISGGSTLASLTQQVAMALGVALAALLVVMSSHAVGAADGAVTLRDFRPALLLAGLSSLLTLFWYRRLHPDVGAALSGRAPVRAPSD
jgi:EmrB/QacA subfamily drug resistance transporter